MKRGDTVDIPIHFTMAASGNPTFEQAKTLIAEILPKLILAADLLRQQGVSPEIAIFGMAPQGAVLQARVGADVLLANLRVLIEQVTGQRIAGEANGDGQGKIIIP